VIYHEVAGTQVETTIPLEPNDDLWHLKIRSFLDASKNGGAAPVSSKQIYYNQAILDGISKSSAVGREIELDLPAWDTL